ncbi:MAG: hypothetical protein R3E90_08975 [Marinicella sp.]|nr:hypothetical protein [Xanthomonadales bacterium]
MKSLKYKFLLFLVTVFVIVQSVAQNISGSITNSGCDVKIQSIDLSTSNILQGYSFDSIEFVLKNDSLENHCSGTYSTSVEIGTSGLFPCSFSQYCLEIIGPEIAVNLFPGESETFGLNNISVPIDFPEFNYNAGPLDFMTFPLRLYIGNGLDSGDSFEVMDAVNIFNNMPPESPVLKYPQNGAIIYIEEILEWFLSLDPNGEAVSYLTRISNSQDPSYDNVNCISSDVKCELSLLNLQHNSIYFWNVQAEDEAGLKSSFSETNYFRTSSPPAEVFYGGFDNFDQRFEFNFIHNGSFENFGQGWQFFYLGTHLLCSMEFCSDDLFAEPHTGDYWARIHINLPIYQSNVHLPKAPAKLQFWLKVPENSVLGDLQVFLGDDLIFEVTPIDYSLYSSYELISIDVSALGDGGQHRLSFTGSGIEGGTRFYIDDVKLLVNLNSN